MAIFDEAFGAVMGDLGGWVQHSEHDHAETFKGISRRFHPTWEGWKIMDALRLAASNESEFNRTVAQNEKLKENVNSFYAVNFWDRFCGDMIPSQEIAEEVLRAAMVLGVRRAVSNLQESLRLLNVDRTQEACITENGLFGPETMQALENYLKSDDPSCLISLMRLLEGIDYVERLRRNPAYLEITRDWLRRTKIVKASSTSRPPAPPKNVRVD
jgi:lysozyme family protein